MNRRHFNCRAGVRLNSGTEQTTRNNQTTTILCESLWIVCRNDSFRIFGYRFRCVIPCIIAVLRCLPTVILCLQRVMCVVAILNAFYLRPLFVINRLNQHTSVYRCVEISRASTWCGRAAGRLHDHTAAIFLSPSSNGRHLYESVPRKTATVTNIVRVLATAASELGLGKFFSLGARKTSPTKSAGYYCTRLVVSTAHIVLVYIFSFLCMCVCFRMSVCVCVCLRVSMCVCQRAGVCVCGSLRCHITRRAEFWTRPVTS